MSRKVLFAVEAVRYFQEEAIGEPDDCCRLTAWRRFWLEEITTGSIVNGDSANVSLW